MRSWFFVSDIEFTWPKSMWQRNSCNQIAIFKICRHKIYDHQLILHSNSSHCVQPLLIKVSFHFTTTVIVGNEISFEIKVWSAVDQQWSIFSRLWLGPSFFWPGRKASDLFSPYVYNRSYFFGRTCSSICDNHTWPQYREKKTYTCPFSFKGLRDHWPFPAPCRMLG